MTDFGDVDRKMPLKIYGFTVLGVFLSVLGVWYLGFFDAGVDLSNCVLPPGFKCLDYSLSPTGAVVYIQNTAGSEVEIATFQIEGCDEVKDVILEKGEREHITVKNCQSATSQRNVRLTYRESGREQSGIGKITTVP